MNTGRACLQQTAREPSDMTAGTDAGCSSGRCVEFDGKGVNRDAGLLTPAKLPGIRPEETTAMGGNDLPVIRAAGPGAGVRNAAEIRPFCDCITAATDSESTGTVGRFILQEADSVRKGEVSGP